MKKHFYFSAYEKAFKMDILAGHLTEVKECGKWIEYTCMQSDLKEHKAFMESDYVYLGCHDEWAIKINGVMQGDEQINAILTDNCNAKINNKEQGIT